MTFDERMERIDKAEHIAAFLEGIGESDSEKKTVKKAIEVIEEYIDYLKEELEDDC